MPGMTSGPGALVASLDQVARLIEAAGVGHSDAGERHRAQRLALALDAQSPGHSHDPGPQVVFAAALLGDLAVDPVAETAAGERLLDDLEQIAGLSRTALGR